MEDLFFNFPQETNQLLKPSGVPTNIYETEDGFHVSLLTPDMKKEDFVINMEQNTLTISYTKPEVADAEKPAYKTIQKEFGTNSFKKSFSIHNKINTENIQAKYENGVLKIYLPKKEEVKIAPKQITIA